MTKEQYLVFKSDLKLAIEGLMPKRLFKTVHHGYSSEEELKEAWNEALKKNTDNSSKIKVRRKGYNGTTYPFISPHSCATHLAYYCAKHQLGGNQITEYVKSEFEKMREPKAYDFSYLCKEVNEILREYGSYKV